jgi:tetratricopeptide (TPR) repeat protein
MEAEQPAELWLEASQTVARRGDVDEAVRLAKAAAEANPDSPDVWRQLAQLTQDPQERQAHIRRAMALDPENAQARTELEADQSSPDGTSSDGKKVWSWVLGALAVVAALLVVAMLLLAAVLVWGPVDVSVAALLPTATPVPSPTPTLSPEQVALQFTPQLRDALSAQNWERALEIVDIVRNLDPDNDEIRRWALETHMYYGQHLVSKREMDLAQEQFDRAVAVAPDNQDVALWQHTTELYRSGEQALQDGQWAAAIEAFGQALEQMPEYGDLPTRLVETYRRQGQAAIGNTDWTTAIESLNEAFQRAPDSAEVASLLSRAYRGLAQAAIDDGQLSDAIEALNEGQEKLPEDKQVANLLATTYRQRGIIREKQGQLQGARADLEATLALQPGDAEAKAHLDRVMYRLFPPKRIEISISRQRFYAYEGDSLLYNFPTSTGLPGRDTAVGNFQVQSKIPMAWSSIWRLSMPYWLGIYWVGNVENGIHALPIRTDGTVMWGGLLGQRASYGCVILSNAAARTIYNWADIGTPVHIYY